MHAYTTLSVKLTSYYLNTKTITVIVSDKNTFRKHKCNIYRQHDYIAFRVHLVPLFGGTIKEGGVQFRYILLATTIILILYYNQRNKKLLIQL